MLEMTPPLQIVEIRRRSTSDHMGPGPTCPVPLSNCSPSLLEGSEIDGISYERRNKRAPMSNAEGSVMLRGGDVKLHCLGKDGSECPADPPVQQRKCPRPARRGGDAVPRALHFNSWLQVHAAFFRHFDPARTAGQAGYAAPSPSSNLGRVGSSPAWHQPDQSCDAPQLDTGPAATGGRMEAWKEVVRLTKGNHLDREQGWLAKVCPKLQRYSPIPEASFIVNLRRKQTRKCLDLEALKATEIAYFFFQQV